MRLRIYLCIYACLYMRVRAQLSSCLYDYVDNSIHRDYTPV